MKKMYPPSLIWLTALALIAGLIDIFVYFYLHENVATGMVFVLPAAALTLLVVFIMFKTTPNFLAGFGGLGLGISIGFWILSSDMFAWELPVSRWFLIPCAAISIAIAIVAVYVANKDLGYPIGEQGPISYYIHIEVYVNENANAVRHRIWNWQHPNVLQIDDGDQIGQPESDLVLSITTEDQDVIRWLINRTGDMDEVKIVYGKKADMED